MRLLLGLIAAVVVGAFGCAGSETEEELAQDSAELKSGAHFVGTPTCTQTGDELTCSGSVAGLGNQAVVVNLTATAFCTNRGGNNPPGQVSGSSGPIAPNNGRINFAVTLDADCPGPMTATFVSPATVTILRGDATVFQGTIAF